MRKEYDFSKAKRASQVPHLVKLQAEYQAQSEVTMPVDSETLAIFKRRAEMQGSSYQSLMGEALRQFAQGLTLADVIKETIKQELHSH
jgi:predicted DNA binding CopG/RHH family protein